MYPSREEFTELIYYISELKHTYSHKIDEQSTKINEQSMIIEELLWQIRELSDKIRQLSQWRIETERVITSSRRKFDELTQACTCCYENHFPKSRIVNSRRSQKATADTVDARPNDKKAADDGGEEEDVYEVIEFSDSSQHIYTEPFDKRKNEYGALRKVKTTTSTSSNQTTAAVSKRSATSKTKMGIKKSNRTRNLQKFPAMQDISKASNRSTDDDDDENETRGKVELRAKSPSSRLTSNRQAIALVSAIGAGSTRESPVNLASFIPQRDVSGILINFGCSSSRPRNDAHERVSY